MTKYVRKIFALKFQVIAEKTAKIDVELFCRILYMHLRIREKWSRSLTVRSSQQKEILWTRAE